MRKQRREYEETCSRETKRGNIEVGARKRWIIYKYQKTWGTRNKGTGIGVGF